MLIENVGNDFENDTWYDAMETDNPSDTNRLNFDHLSDQLIIDNNLFPPDSNSNNNSHNHDSNKLQPIRQFADL
ncbi:unnamed protein product [Heterobilharzia americana]|nr:unnamed protein product [Heterobilharzia americana]